MGQGMTARTKNEGRTKGARGQDARMRAQARRIALREASSAIDALGVRLGTLAALTLQGRHEEARGMLAANCQDFTAHLQGAARTSNVLKEWLALTSEEMSPDWSAGVRASAEWLMRRDERRGPLMRTLLKAARRLSAWAAAPWRAWRRMRLEAARRDQAAYFAWRNAQRAAEIAASQESKP